MKSINFGKKRRPTDAFFFFSFASFFCSAKVAFCRGGEENTAAFCPSDGREKKKNSYFGKKSKNTLDK